MNDLLIRQAKADLGEFCVGCGNNKCTFQITMRAFDGHTGNTKRVIVTKSCKAGHGCDYHANIGIDVPPSGTHTSY